MTMNPMTKYCLISLFIVIVVASILLQFASNDPDGLEKVAQTLGFDDMAKETNHFAPMRGYDATGDGSYAGMLIAGTAGALATLFMGFGAGKLIKGKRRQE